MRCSPTSDVMIEGGGRERGEVGICSQEIMGVAIYENSERQTNGVDGAGWRRVGREEEWRCVGGS